MTKDQEPAKLPPPMSFQTLDYLLFLAAVALLLRLVAAHRTARLALLVTASYAFYAFGRPLHLLVLVGLTGVDWLFIRAIHRARAARRKLLLSAAVAVDLLVLAAFKYAAFLSGAVTGSLAALGAGVEPVTISLGFPLGVSFYVFSSLTCSIDVYRGRCEPPASLLDYAAFVSFFPKIVAGPIARARQFLPQLASPPDFTDAATSHGLFLVLAGLVKKIALADFLGRNLVERVFDAPQRYSSLEVLAGVYAYTFQIYCDFSGLTDIAIGSALILGFRLPRNFDLPYRSADLQEFWRRWHMSLSTWLRDYLYVPLGGNRRGRARTYLNLFLTMLLGGLWHGAGWTFLAWGGLHGLGLAATRAVQRLRARLGRPRAPTFAGRLLGGVLTFHFVAFCWIFFRAPDFDAARAVLAKLGEGTTWAPNLTPTILGVLGVAVALHFLPRLLYERARAAFVGAPAVAQAAVLVAAGFALASVATRFVPFIYQGF
ncbi:MAG: MBOAT family protein [Deltaproteobacteria bacterium]|nr:MBOAT family protein [Deltaproteobacteria bacterium]